MIAVAFVACWSVCTAVEDPQPVNNIEPHDDIFTQCPYPDINPENTTTNIAHESDCTKFYKCLLGRGTEQRCPLIWPNDKKKRLHYNRALQVCDWPWNAGCELCPPKGANGKYPPASKIEDPDSTNCRKYITCKANGKQEKGTCKTGTCFSRTCQDCVKDREGGNCEGPRPTPDDPCELEEQCDPGDKKCHPCNCNKFFKCTDDEEWELETCAGGQHFSPSTKKCTTPDKAKCPSQGKYRRPGEIIREVHSQE